MDITELKLYLFEGLPLWTDLRREGDIQETNAWVHLRRVRSVWRSRNERRDPRYLVYVDGFAFASDSMSRCKMCKNERPRIGEKLMCMCERFMGAW